MTETPRTPTPNMGIRIELYDAGQALIASVTREDLHTTFLPHVGERIAPSSFSSPVADLVGLLPSIVNVEHHIDLPGGRSPGSFATIVVHANRVSRRDLSTYRAELEAQGWQIMEFRERANPGY